MQNNNEICGIKPAPEWDVVSSKSSKFSIANSLKLEIRNILRDLKVPEDIIENCDIDTLLKKYFQRNAIVKDDARIKTQMLEQEKEVAQQEDKRISGSKIRYASILENLEKLDERITLLENQIRSFLPNTTEPAKVSNNLDEKKKSHSIPEVEVLEDVVIADIAAENAKIEEKKPKRKPEHRPYTYFQNTKLLALHQHQIDHNLLKKKMSNTSLLLNLRPAFNNLAPPSQDSVKRYLRKTARFGEDY